MRILRWSLPMVLAACAEPGAAPDPPAGQPAPSGHTAVVLGIAQDGGVPQVNCRKPFCESARRDPTRAHMVSSLALLDLQERRTWLIDATPDLPRQLELLARDPELPLRAGRSPLDGVLLTHAHMGHYLGLAHMGREALGTQGLPVYCTSRMGEFLRRNGPWSQLVAAGGVELLTLEPGRPLQLGGLSLLPLEVPHRDEYSDALAFVVKGPRRSLLYVSDIDSWEPWDLEAQLQNVDWALLDGTFYSRDELPDRVQAKVPHPPVVETMQRLEAAGPFRARVFFIHLNHTNPLLDPDGEALRKVRGRGFDVAREGQRFPL